MHRHGTVRDGIAACALVILFAGAAMAQPSDPTAEPPRAPEPPARLEPMGSPAASSEPAQAAPGPPVDPAPQPVAVPPAQPVPGMGAPSPEPRRAASSQSGWMLDFLRQYPQAGTVLAVVDLARRPLLFLAVLILVGSLLGGFATRLVPQPPGAGSGSRAKPDPDVQRHQAALQLAAWIIALLLAGQAAGLGWLDVAERASVGLRDTSSGILSVVLRAVSTVIGWTVSLVIAGLIAYSATPQSRDLILSLMGAYYLRRHPNRPTPDQSFDLGDGQMGTVQSVDSLHTTFVLSDGRKRTMPNAWLMRTHFHWGQTPPQNQEVAK